MDCRQLLYGDCNRLAFNCKQGLGMGFLAALSTGIFSVAWWPALPDLCWYVVLICLLSVVVGCCPWSIRLKSVAMLLVISGWGSLWGLWCAYDLLDHQLPAELQGQDLLVSGTVIGLVDRDERRSRFSFAIDSRDKRQGQPDLRLLLLSWYDSQADNLVSGHRCNFIVRLRRPRGLVNSAGFDYQSWLLQQGYSAVGSVRSLEQDCVNSSGFGARLGRLRSSIQGSINAADMTNNGILVALSVGSKRQLTDQWDNLVRLGIVHLVVISGLHIGLVAALCTWLGTGLSRLLLLQGQLQVGRWLPSVLGFLGAGYYSLLAGFSLPSQRALIAVAVVMLARLLYRRISPVSCLIWALLLIAIDQPLAVLGAGFWLSFLAVALLLLWFLPWHPKAIRSTFRSIIGVQFALMVALLVPSLLYMGKASWLAPMVNIIAVPWISLVTVPLCVFASLLFSMSEVAAVFLWRLADYSVSALWLVLDLVPQSIGLITSPVAINIWLVLGTTIAVFGLLMPGGLRGKWLCCLPVCALLLTPVKTMPLRLTVLDMGQGLGLVLETRNRTLVYDTGPAFGSGFNGGSGIIAPYLRSRGINHIDLLIVSHGDNDHAGGYEGLMQSVNAGDQFFGKDFSPTGKHSVGHSNCYSGQRWVWSSQSGPLTAASEPIYLSMLSPHKDSSFIGNNSSCVLLIEWRDQRILLPGDIERAAEALLLAKLTPQLTGPITLLVAPHHGSKTSSTADFVTMFEPENVIFSAGYRHHFGHPHPQVVRRYQAAGSRIWSTAEHGAISFVWDQSGRAKVVSARRDGWRFWWR